MTISLFVPYTLVTDSGLASRMSPTVDTLPLAPTLSDNVILTESRGTSLAGMYQWNSTLHRWQFAVDYKDICSQLFGVAAAYLCLVSKGTTLLPIGPSGNALVIGYKNSIQFSDYNVSNSGIVLNRASALNETYLILQISPIKANTIISGGIPDVPSDDIAYVRKNQNWVDIQEELNEGLYHG